MNENGVALMRLGSSLVSARHQKAIGRLSELNIRDHGAKVMAKFRRQAFPLTADLADNWIMNGGHILPPINSSGVQILGGLRPCLKMIRSIRSAISALAK